MEEEEVVRRYVEIDDENRRYIEVDEDKFLITGTENCECSLHSDQRVPTGQPYEHIR